jgi:hypothetical protein
MDSDHTYDPTHIRECGHCGIKYDWRRSASSSLKMTYCGSLCEMADLGFTIEALIHTERQSSPSVVSMVKELLATAA